MDGKEMSDQPHLNIDMAIVSQVMGKHLQGESPNMSHQDAHNNRQSQKRQTRSMSEREVPT